jgi:ABC-type glycerol-3-phosphate transport system substrate-binding protein
MARNAGDPFRTLAVRRRHMLVFASATVAVGLLAACGAGTAGSSSATSPGSSATATGSTVPVTVVTASSTTVSASTRRRIDDGVNHSTERRQ